MPIVTGRIIKSASLIIKPASLIIKISITEGSALPKIQTVLAHGHSLTGGMDKLTALKDKSGKEALKKKPCPHVLCILLLSIFQDIQKTPALLR